ncbi:MAG: hypothetical protein LBQ14_08920 [Treponema sp.]|jgi:hypothetical protein|nr:hypothetical protein [Treponema sp.]
MRLNLSRKTTARLVFIAGLLLMLLGSAFLLGTLTDASRLSVLGSFFFVIIGAGLAFIAIKLTRRSIYLFFACFFILIGFFLFLSVLQIVSFSFSQGWPFLSVFAGLALIPAGWYHYNAVKGRYVVPALVFIILGCILTVFSFDIVPFSFKQFILNWWPIVVALAGLLLLLLSLGTKKAEDQRS